MGILDGKNHVDYYTGNDLGNYQFESLDVIVNEFMITYVGDNKIIPKIRLNEVAFFARRAFQELSFDTFKSIKAQQIDVPPTLQMPLPHDYVNYTKISSVDSSGIKHPLYPTKHTSNPFQILQDDEGEYSFPEDAEEVFNGTTFSTPTFLNGWSRSPKAANSGTNVAGYGGADNKLSFFHGTRNSHNATNWGHALAVWQELDVSDKEFVDVSAIGQAVDLTNGEGILRLGLSTNPGSTESRNPQDPNSTAPQTTNVDASIFNLTDHENQPSYVEWRSSDGAVSKEILSVDVRNLNVIYVIIVSWHDFIGAETTAKTNNIRNVSVIHADASKFLQEPEENKGLSSTWTNFKSNNPSENDIHDYRDYNSHIYWPNEGERYGLEPSHAQVNGSFYIEERLGKIHFSSNISGKTVILDYISDSIGTDAEMHVHKFAQEAMYKHMLHAIISGSSYGQALVPRLTKEKFAAVRKAKLRLSNIKLEELTQILRGKSKWIKH